MLVDEGVVRLAMPVKLEVDLLPLYERLLATDLEDRLARMRARQRDGGPDMTPDELQAAIDRPRSIVSGYQEGSGVARILSTMPRAAELCEKRIALGLMDDSEACEEARIILRSLIPGRIRLSKKPDGSLWAHCAIQPAALLASTGTWSG